MHVLTRTKPFPLAHQTFPGLEFFSAMSGLDTVLLVTLDKQQLGAIVREFNANGRHTTSQLCYSPRTVRHEPAPMDEAVRWILQHYVHPEDKAFTSKVRSLWRMSRLDLLRVYNNADSWVVAPASLPLLKTTEPRYFSDREEALSAANIDVFLGQLQRRFLTSTT